MNEKQTIQLENHLSEKYYITRSGKRRRKYPMPKTKICKMCGVEKDVSEFNLDNDKFHLKPDCKKCQYKKALVRVRANGYEYSKRPEIKLRARKLNNTPEYKARRHKYYLENIKGTGKYNEYYKKWVETYPEKQAAKLSITKIKVPKGMVKHHWNYNKEYWSDYIVLTRGEHATAHMMMKYDQDNKMFLRPDGIILHTKIKHLNYIKSLSLSMPG